MFHLTGQAPSLPPSALTIQHFRECRIVCARAAVENSRLRPDKIISSHKLTHL